MRLLSWRSWRFSCFVVREQWTVGRYAPRFSGFQQHDSQVSRVVRCWFELSVSVPRGLLFHVIPAAMRAVCWVTWFSRDHAICWRVAESRSLPGVHVVFIPGIPLLSAGRTSRGSQQVGVPGPKTWGNLKCSQNCNFKYPKCREIANEPRFLMEQVGFAFPCPQWGLVAVLLTVFVALQSAQQAVYWAERQWWQTGRGGGPGGGLAVARITRCDM